jgi:hypothetical protein
MNELDKIENNRLLQLVNKELEFFNAGGYGRSFRSQWRPTLLLRDSPACINYGDTGRQNPCRACPLFALIPPDKRDELVPCHFIPLNESGLTIARLYAEGSQDSLDRLYEYWLHDIIKKLNTP